MEIDELRRALEEHWESDRPHSERLVLAAAVLQTALRDAGMVATLVGGGAIEFYAPGAYTTSDIDLVVERKTREAIHEVLPLWAFPNRAGTGSVVISTWRYPGTTWEKGSTRF